MPISAIDGCSESHWSDVLDIVSEAVEMSSFVPNLVSNADEVGIIHKRIIQNLYDNPMVVCDVSGKNPNVMFELGLRLALISQLSLLKMIKRHILSIHRLLNIWSIREIFDSQKLLNLKKNLLQKLKQHINEQRPITLIQLS
jgi:hypothetical protein